MGLDMYLKGETFIWKDRPKKDGFEVEGQTLKLGYWRKHPDLHGYIVREFANGVDECQKIPLTEDNIVRIIDAIKRKKLPHTKGFFFGASDGSEDAESIAIFEKALEWLRNGTPPRKREAQPLAAGMAVAVFKLEDFEAATESREVYYQASW